MTTKTAQPIATPAIIPTLTDFAEMVSTMRRLQLTCESTHSVEVRRKCRGLEQEIDLHCEQILKRRFAPSSLRPLYPDDE